jgi:FkbM family methyltransferase
MLIPLEKCFEIFRKKSFELSGVVHIGAHLGEECQDYANKGFKEILWIEANRALMKELYDKTNPICFPRGISQKFICAAVSDVDGEEVNFNITNNGQSSSILELGTHSSHHPHVQVVSTRKLKTVTFKTLKEQQKLDMSKYQFMNLDIQGAELKALKGFGELLDGFKAIYTEVNSEEVYKGCAVMPELDTFLGEKGFIRILTVMTEYRWGDALYVRR